MSAARLVVAAALAFAMQGAGAQAPLKAGDGELSLGGALVHQDDCCGGNLTTLNAGIRYGHLFTANHELGIGLGLFWADSDTFGSNVDGLAGPFYKYNFVNNSPWVPFVAIGADVLLGTGSDLGEVTHYDASAGVQYFVNPVIAINANVFHVWSNGQGGLDATGIRWGFSWFTKR